MLLSWHPSPLQHVRTFQISAPAIYNARCLCYHTLFRSTIFSAELSVEKKEHNSREMRSLTYAIKIQNNISPLADSRCCFHFRETAWHHKLMALSHITVRVEHNCCCLRQAQAASPTQSSNNSLLCLRARTAEQLRQLEEEEKMSRS